MSENISVSPNKMMLVNETSDLRVKNVISRTNVQDQININLEIELIGTKRF